MSVFGNFERTDLDAAVYGESRFCYLDRSNRPEFTAARTRIEDWFSRYPLRGRAELLSRLRDRNTADSFDSAFFELFLHEFFIRVGCTIEVHPESSGSTKKPDFLVGRNGTAGFFVEAIVATGQSREDRAMQSRTDDFYNALDQIACPDYFIIAHHYDFNPSTPIPLSKVRGQTQRWIDALDYEQVAAIPVSDSFDDLPSHVIEHDGGYVKLVAVPKKREARGSPGVRPVGGHSNDGIVIRAHVEVRNAVKKKSASRYDLGGLPYVVAVNCQERFTRDEDIERALYGIASGYAISNQDQLPIADLEGGVWAGRRGATNTSLSAVLCVRNLDPCTPQNAKICLYKNPWPKRPVDTQLLAVTEACLTTQGIVYSPRKSLEGFW